MKATSATANGVYAGEYANVTVSGGYLDATGANGIYGDVTNSGGVIKATGKTNGISGALTARGGVTIATGGSGRAVSGDITLESGEKVLKLSDGNTYAEAQLENNQTTETALVVAKEAYGTVSAYNDAHGESTTLDGVYLKYSETNPTKMLTFKTATTITGGNYVENIAKNNEDGAIVGCRMNAALSNNGTLVSIGEDCGISCYHGSPAVNGTGTLIGIGASGVSRQSSNGADIAISGGGNIIGVGTTGYGVYCGKITDGSVIGIGTNGVKCQEISENACVTGEASTGNGVNFATIADSKVSGYASDTGCGIYTATTPGTAIISGLKTLIGAYSAGGNAIHCGASTYFLVKCAAGLSEPFYDGYYYNSTYEPSTVGSSAAKVVYISPNVTTKPTANNTTAAKESVEDNEVTFTLDKPAYAPSLEWHVYDTMDDDTPSSVTAAYADGNKLTLTGVSAVISEAVSYYVSVTQMDRLPSARLKLTVTPYVAPSPAPSGGGGGSYTPTLVTDIKSGGSTTASNLDRLISGKKDLTVTDTGGAKLVFDTEALKGIDSQTTGSVTVKIEDVSGKYQDTQKGKTVFSLTATSGGKAVTDFGGSVTVTLPYKLGDGESAENVKVWYLASDGTMTEIPCTYDAKTGLATFTVTHFSEYVVGIKAPWVNPFLDVTESDWFYGDAAYAAEKGLMSGVSADTFAPHAATSRGMIVTILHRLDGKPAAEHKDVFSDVAEGAYYHDAVLWAAQKGIVTGYDNGSFGPDDDVTREQLAAILYRYAKYKGYDVSVGEDTNILSYNDAFTISEYAIPAIQWACGAGLINGSSGNLMPQGKAERCQTAAILHRFCENAAK